MWCHSAEKSLRTHFITSFSSCIAVYRSSILNAHHKLSHCEWSGLLAGHPIGSDAVLHPLNRTNRVSMYPNAVAATLRGIHMLQLQHDSFS